MISSPSLFYPIEEECTLKPLRGRQIALDAAIYASVRAGHRRIIVQLPTGGGKTIIAAHLMDRSAKKGKRPMFVAPAIALIEQTLRSFEAQGISDIGIIQAQHRRTDWRAQVQIASRDTLIRRPLPEVDFVIIDEAHDQRDALNAILDGEAWKNKIIVGLSATPWSRGLGLHWDHLIIGATISDMISDGYLCPFRVFGVTDEYEPDMSGVNTVAGEFQEAGAARVMGEAKIVGNTVDTWLKYRQEGLHPGDRTFLYGVNRAHARSLMDAFLAAGIPCGYIDGNSPPEERLRTFERYRRREDKILCNVGVLVTGVDEDVRCIQDCQPVKSQIRHVQKIGRGLRIADGKEYCLILDHAGNHTRKGLGMVTDIHHEALDKRKPGDKAEGEDEKPVPQPRKCGNCCAMIPPATRVCPACGAIPVVQNRIAHEKGELVEVKAKNPQKDEKQEFFSGLLYIAASRGFKPGWAANKYRVKYGVWPRGVVPVPRPPGVAVRKFDKEQRREYLAQLKAGQSGEIA